MCMGLNAAQGFRWILLLVVVFGCGRGCARAGASGYAAGRLALRRSHR